MANSTALLERPASQIDEERIEKILLKSSEKVRRKLLKGLHEEYKAESDAKISGQKKEVYKNYANSKLTELAKKMEIDDVNELKKLAHKILWKELQKDKEKNTQENIDTLKSETSKKVRKLLKKSLRLHRESKENTEKKEPALKKNAELIVEQLKTDKQVRNAVYYELARMFDTEGRLTVPFFTQETEEKTDKILYRLSRKKGLKKAVWDILKDTIGWPRIPKKPKDEPEEREERTEMMRPAKPAQEKKDKAEGKKKPEKKTPSKKASSKTVKPKPVKKKAQSAPSTEVSTKEPEAFESSTDIGKMIEDIRNIQIDLSEPGETPVKKPEDQKQEPTSIWGSISGAIGSVKEVIFGEEKKEDLSPREGAKAIIKLIEEKNTNKKNQREIKAELLVIIQKLFEKKVSVEGISNRSKKKDARGIACQMIINILGAEKDQREKSLSILRFIESELATKGKGGRPLPINDIREKSRKKKKPRITVEVPPKKKKKSKETKAIGMDTDTITNPKANELSEEQLKDLREGLQSASKAVNELEDDAKKLEKGSQKELYEEGQDIESIAAKVKENLNEALEQMLRGGESEELPNGDEKRNNEAVEGYSTPAKKDQQGVEESPSSKTQKKEEEVAALPGKTAKEQSEVSQQLRAQLEDLDMLTELYAKAKNGSEVVVRANKTDKQREKYSIEIDGKPLDEKISANAMIPVLIKNGIDSFESRSRTDVKESSWVGKKNENTSFLDEEPVFDQLDIKPEEIVEFSISKKKGSRKVLATVEPHPKKSDKVVVVTQKPLKGKTRHTINLKSAQNRLSKIAEGSDEEAIKEPRLTRGKNVPEKVTPIKPEEQAERESQDRSKRLEEELLVEVGEKKEKAQEKPEKMTKKAILTLLQHLDLNTALTFKAEEPHGEIKVAKTKKGNLKLIRGSLKGINKHKAYGPQGTEKIAQKLSELDAVEYKKTEKHRPKALKISDRENIPDWESESKIKIGEPFRVRNREFIDGQLANYTSKKTGKTSTVRIFKSPEKDAVILKPKGSSRQFAISNRSSFDRLKPIPVKEKQTDTQNAPVDKKKASKKKTA